MTGRSFALVTLGVAEISAESTVPSLVFNVNVGSAPLLFSNATPAAVNLTFLFDVSKE